MVAVLFTYKFCSVTKGSNSFRSDVLLRDKMTLHTALVNNLTVSVLFNFIAFLFVFGGPLGGGEGGGLYRAKNVIIFIGGFHFLHWFRYDYCGFRFISVFDRMIFSRLVSDNM